MNIVDVERRILAKNDASAAKNRAWLAGREILALNLVSSPGAGKTTLLEHTIRDLAGLWSPEWLFRGAASVDDLCRRDRPDAIFLPHRNYAGLNRELIASDCLKNYVRVTEASSSPLYVRADHAQTYLDCSTRAGETRALPR